MVPLPRIAGEERKIVLAARFFAPEFLRSLVIARSGSDEAIQNSQCSQLDCFAIARNGDNERPRKIKGSGTPADARFVARTQAACGTRHGKGGLRRPPLAGALACRRSTAVLTSGIFVPKAQRRARLPENGAKAAACRTHRLGHSEAPRAPVLVPAGMMPEPPGCGVYLSARGRRTRSVVWKYPPRRRPLRARLVRLLPSRQ
jgi:hypothetical protein